jgi:hypothetical protein
VQEIVHVFMMRNDTRRNVVILDGETAPLDRRATEVRTRVQECLHATLAYDFDSWNNRPTKRWPKRHVDALNPQDWMQAGG